MKAITLTQPWADLMGRGIKQVETRSWRTHYRGLIAIHASRDCRANGEAMIIGCETSQDGKSKPVLRFPFSKHFPADYSEIYGGLSNGGIECVVRLVDCLPAPYVAQLLRDQARRERANGNVELAEACLDEIAFGDYSAGRWAWITRYVARVGYSEVVRGRQGLWNLPEEVDRQVMRWVFKSNTMVDGNLVDYTGPAYQLAEKSEAA